MENTKKTKKVRKFDVKQTGVLSSSDLKTFKGKVI